MRTAAQKEIDMDIAAVIDRLERELPEHFTHENRPYWVLRCVSVADKIAIHWDLMLTARLSDVAHDFGGFRNHWDGEKFSSGFWPRFAVNQ